MARTDTLTNFLTDVASAIKTKKGDQTDILASNFDTEIANLPGGGGDVSEYFNTTFDETVIDINNTFANKIIKKFPTITIANGITSLEYAFSYTNITSMSFEGIDCSNITSLSYIFVSNTKLKTIDLANITNTLNVTSVDGIFQNDTALETISNMFPLTGNVVCRSAFYGCKVKELDLSNWNITVTNSSSMFYATTNMTVLDISNMVFSSVSTNNFKNCGINCLQSDGAYADGIPYVYVKDATEQSKILNIMTAWSTNNVVIKSNQ